MEIQFKSWVYIPHWSQVSVQRRLLCDGCLHWLLKGKTDLLFVWRERRILFVAFTKSQNRSWKSNLKAAFTFQKRVFRDSWLCWLLKGKLDPVDSTVCYEMMKLCTGSVKHSNGWYLVVLSQCKVELVNSWWHWVCMPLWSGAFVTQFLHRKLHPKQAHMLQSW